MAQTTVVRLTGEDLTAADVWEVAVEGVAAELDDSARVKMAAAREVVDRAVAAEGPTYGVTTGFGRFVSDAGARRSWPRSSSSDCCAAMRAASASPIRTRSSGQRCSCARTRLRRGTPGLARRSPSACSIVSSTVSCRRCRAEARSGRAGTSLHWLIWRCRSSARDALGSAGSFSRAPTRSPGQGSSRFASRPRKGSRS